MFGLGYGQTDIRGFEFWVDRLNISSLVDANQGYMITDEGAAQIVEFDGGDILVLHGLSFADADALINGAYPPPPPPGARAEGARFGHDDFGRFTLHNGEWLLAG